MHIKKKVIPNQLNVRRPTQQELILLEDLSLYFCVCEFSPRERKLRIICFILQVGLVQEPAQMSMILMGSRMSGLCKKKHKIPDPRELAVHLVASSSDEEQFQQDEIPEHRTYRKGSVLKWKNLKLCLEEFLSLYPPQFCYL